MRRNFFQVTCVLVFLLAPRLGYSDQSRESWTEPVTGIKFLQIPGTMTARYWGDEVGMNRANCNGCGSHWDYRQTAPVKSFAPNPFGVYDILGNVWEWTCSAYKSSYGGSESRCADQAETFSIRGGSWYHQPRWMRSAHRRFSRPIYRVISYGFRLARD